MLRADQRLDLMMTARRGACIILEGARGHRGAARALVGRAIRKALGVRRWGTEPHYVSYVSLSEARSYGLANPRFTVVLSDAEMARLEEVLLETAEAEGWERPPVDIYHD